MVEVSLRIRGIDLEDESIDEIILENFPATLWSSTDQISTVTMFVDTDDIVAQVEKIAMDLETKISGLKVLGVYRDLVGVSDIANRAGVSREAARKWAIGEDFPEAEDFISAARMKVWAWAEVVAWLKDHRGVDLGLELPSTATMKQIDYVLARVRVVSRSWNPVRTSFSSHSSTPAKFFKPTMAAGDRALGRETPCRFDSVDAVARPDTRSNRSYIGAVTHH